uniref:Uncharacterized protein n=1 Tax=Spironucleus salmonicida TaxID=348837 RepID=V6LF55_9EUKA|eukprot:EST43132.1 Hypothetical protein SS50377_17217 [Spironucleus salmonicida]
MAPVLYQAYEYQDKVIHAVVGVGITVAILIITIIVSCILYHYIKKPEKYSFYHNMQIGQHPKSQILTIISMLNKCMCQQIIFTRLSTIIYQLNLQTREFPKTQTDIQADRFRVKLRRNRQNITVLQTAFPTHILSSVRALLHCTVFSQMTTFAAQNHEIWRLICALAQISALRRSGGFCKARAANYEILCGAEVVQRIWQVKCV